MRLRFAWTLLGAVSLWTATAAAQPAPSVPPPAGTVPPGAPPGQPLPPNLGPQPPPGQPLPPPVGPQPPPGQPLPPPVGPQPPPGQPLPPPVGPQPPPGQPLPPPVGPQPPPGQPLPPANPPAGPGAPPPASAAPAAKPPELPGISHGVPLARRGQIAIEAAAFTSTELKESSSGSELSLIALALNVHIPIRETTFLDARLPVASYLPGNIMLGASQVLRLDPKGFLFLGGQLGLPLVTNHLARPFALPNGTWNMHEYQPNFMPIKLVAGYERLLFQAFTFRLELEPVLSIPIGDHGYDVGFAFQHALEAQYGHSFGAGLRVQGVAVTQSLLDDAYQLAVEPFLVVRRELGFARLGLLLPLNEGTAGPPFTQAWGLRLWAGLHID